MIKSDIGLFYNTEVVRRSLPHFSSISSIKGHGYSKLNRINNYILKCRKTITGKRLREPFIYLNSKTILIFNKKTYGITNILQG